MTRTSLDDFACSWARTAEIIGDKWTIMILRDMFGGVQSFSDFKKRLGIAGNVLTDRLNQLCAQGIVEKRPIREGVERFDYVLTPRGRELFPIFVAMMQWGDKWLFGVEGEPIRMIDRQNGAPMQPMLVTAMDGRCLGPDEVTYVAGPGLDMQNTLPGGRIRRNAVKSSQN